MKNLLLSLVLVATVSAGDFEAVPAPDSLPYYEKSAKLGVFSALKVDFSRTPFRCGGCNFMQPAHSWMAWVPDAVRAGDPIGLVLSVVQREQYNGTVTGWCIKCAPKLEANWEARRDADRERRAKRLRDTEASLKPGETMLDVVGWAADSSGDKWEILRNGQWKEIKKEQP